MGGGRGLLHLHRGSRILFDDRKADKKVFLRGTFSGFLRNALAYTIAGDREKTRRSIQISIFATKSSSGLRQTSTPRGKKIPLDEEGRGTTTLQRKESLSRPTTIRGGGERYPALVAARGGLEKKEKVFTDHPQGKGSRIRRRRLSLLSRGRGALRRLCDSPSDIKETKVLERRQPHATATKESR